MVPHDKTACSRCGKVGRRVGDETIEAILKPAVAARLIALERWFCTTPSCGVVYYAADGVIAEKYDAVVRIGLKETDDPVPLCYCIGITRADVRREVHQSGACTIPARIEAEIRAANCRCVRENPSGACCLGDIKRAVKEAKEMLESGHAHANQELEQEDNACCIQVSSGKN